MTSRIRESGSRAATWRSDFWPETVLATTKRQKTRACIFFITSILLAVSDHLKNDHRHIVMLIGRSDERLDLPEDALAQLPGFQVPVLFDQAAEA